MNKNLFVFFLLFLCVANCKSGSITLFDDGNDGLEPGKLETNNIVGSIHRSNLISESPTNNIRPLMLVKRDSPKETQAIFKCINCRNRMKCITGKCTECDIYCKNLPDTEDNEFMMLKNSPEVVGISNRMSLTPQNDIFSKTLYPISTYRAGETKDIICRLVGITDTTDIETVTIWVTTYTNNPPKVLNPIMNDQPKDQQGSDSKHITDSNEPNPDLKSRFNEYDEDQFPRISDDDNENIRRNPDIIEGPPPLLGTNNNIDPSEAITGPTNSNIIVEPPEFESDSPDNSVDSPTVPSDQAIDSIIKPNKIITTGKPSLISRLKELTEKRLKKLSSPPTLKSVLPKNLQDSSTKSDSDEIPEVTSVPLFKGMHKTEEIIDPLSVLGDPIESPSTKPVDADGQISKINDAIQEVQSIVRKMQEDASKASENRLLGSDLSSAASPATPNPVLPNHVVDNFKKVNQYIKNRAQDVLDAIKDPENAEKQDSLKDEHSDMTKNLLSNFKKMPQYVLDRVQDSLSKLSNGKTVENGSINENNVEVKERFGNDDTLSENVGLSNNNEDPIETTPVESPTTKTYKTKLDKYLAELKEKRQKIYSPEKFKLDNTKDPYNLKSARINQQNSILSRSGDDSSDTNTEAVTNSILESLNKQRELLKDKIQSYIEDANTKRGQKNQNIENDNAIDGMVEARPNNDLPNLDRDKNIKENKGQDGEKPDKLKKYVSKLKSRMNLEKANLQSAAKKAQSNLKSVQDEDKTREFLRKLSTPFPKLDKAPEEFSYHLAKGRSDINDGNLEMESPDEVTTPESVDQNEETREFLNKLNTPFPKMILPPEEFPYHLAQGRNNENDGNLELKSPFDEKPTENSLDSQVVSKQPEKIKKYFEKLKSRMNLDKPFLKPAQNTENLLNSRFGNDPITENTPNQRTESMFGNKDAKKKALKAKLQEYMAKVKKPRLDQETVKQQPPLIKNRLQPIQPVTSRITGLTTPKSIEKQKSELNAMMDNLKSMLKERMAKKSEPTVYEIVNGGPNEENLQSVVPNSPESVLGDTNSGGEVIGDTDEQLVPSLESRNTLESTQPASDWSSSLGQIVSASSNPNEVFFMASGIKLPMKIVKQEDGTLDLSLDLEKLCACKNTTCPQNPAVIEETVGAILEKEAEIEDQLNIENTIIDGSKRHKSELSKRSPDMSKYPSPNLDNVLNEINDFGKKIKHSFSKTVNEVQKDIDQTNNAIVKGIRTDKISDIPKINPKITLIKNILN
ncbi:uncharacterized protein LOC115876266 isoform X2 [Sitophilus oryzae]|uniref:Uncharacterized protein LOC115876266 isoform X2 n=1 Tax=Sitophilus oryzae TaxID=7048 RepID=A0A6J2X9H3_SITOR|nr:uncharacterized protein LOC115876266 isoform X2 [Sitophilus oryzae]